MIARYIASLIDDGATLAVGLGRGPNEMLKYLTNRQDLGIQSDVITEPLVDLVIAHPNFGQQLLDEAKRLGYVSQEQTLRSRQACPEDEERESTLADGHRLHIRPTRASDVRAFQMLFHDLRPEDIYTRFFTSLRSSSNNKARHLCNVDYENEMAYAAGTGDMGNERLIGSCCYFADPSTRLTDVAFRIHAEDQGKGLGTILVQQRMDYGRRHGLRVFTADVLSENKPMLRVFEKSGAKTETKLESGVFEVTLLSQ